MCGLVGVAGKLEYKDEELMKRLFCHDYWRGKDSTGLGAIRTSGEMLVAKLASHPLDLFEMQPFKTALSGSSSKAFIGHNRLATKGAITTFNAHPFHYGTIVGAHNGTLTKESHEALEKALGERFTVDSQALIAAIDKLGIKEAIALCESAAPDASFGTAGAWALTWFDKNDNTINFLRNCHRPLWYAYSEKYDKVFWASEHWMINAAANAVEYTLAKHETTKGRFEFFSVQEDWHYKLDLEKLRAGSTERPKPKVCEVKGKEPKKVGFDADPFGRGTGACGQSSSTTHYHGTMGNYGGQNSTSSDSNRRFNRKDEPDIPTKILHFVGDKKNPYAGLIDPDTFETMARYGCGWCKKPVAWGDVGVTIYMKDNVILCPECCRTDEKNQIRIMVKNIKEFVQ